EPRQGAATAPRTRRRRDLLPAREVVRGCSENCPTGRRSGNGGGCAMTPEERRAWRGVYGKDPRVVSERYIHEWHAEIAENRLAHEGVKPELLAYVQRIGEVAK